MTKEEMEAWFKRHTHVSHSFLPDTISMEDLYQAFKARLISELFPTAEIKQFGQKPLGNGS